MKDFNALYSVPQPIKSLSEAMEYSVFCVNFTIPLTESWRKDSTTLNSVTQTTKGR